MAASPSRTLRWLPCAALVIDVLAVCLSAGVGLLARLHTSLLPGNFSTQTALGWPALLMIMGWIASIAALGGYDRATFGHGAEEFVRVGRATFMTTAVVGVGCYLTKYDLSRGFFLLSLIAGIPLVLGGRLALRKVIHSARRHGILRIRVLVAGSAAHVDEVATVLNSKPWLGYSVVGAVMPEGDPTVETDTGVPVLGSVDEVVAVAAEAGADMIFFAAGSVDTGQALRERVWQLEQHDIDVVVAPSLSDVSGERITVRPIGGMPLIHIQLPTWAKASRLSKRTFDVVGSAVLILALAPVFALAALQIWLHDRGPLVYRQQRVGRRNEYFDCFKFRTMIVNADDLKAELQEQADQVLLFKMKDDPRITPPGRWLRRFSIDELPQLFNVLRGDMSLVGPRPQVQQEVDLYEGPMERRLLVRPGMTGLWQVSGRSDLSAEESIRLDLFYVDNWSMLQDVAILFRTVRAVVGSSGAY
ncbi:sugar transferase [Nocardioides maradonensis]